MHCIFPVLTFILNFCLTAYLHFTSAFSSLLVLCSLSYFFHFYLTLYLLLFFSFLVISFSLATSHIRVEADRTAGGTVPSATGLRNLLLSSNTFLRSINSSAVSPRCSVSGWGPKCIDHLGWSCHTPTNKLHPRSFSHRKLARSPSIIWIVWNLYPPPLQDGFKYPF